MPKVIYMFFLAKKKKFYTPLNAKCNPFKFIYMIHASNFYKLKVISTFIVQIKDPSYQQTQIQKDTLI